MEEQAKDSQNEAAKVHSSAEHHKKQEPKKPIMQSLLEFYDKKYKLLLVIPILMLFLAIAQISYQIYSTGDFLHKDISLKGGVTLTIPYNGNVDIIQLETQILKEFPTNDIVVRTLRSAGSVTGVIIEADIDGNDKAQVGKLESSIESLLSVDLSNLDYGLEITGSSLGESFFRESIIALAVAFLFMGIVVFIYFRTYIPSIAIILATLSDMLIALAVVNLLGIKIGTAGIAAFLMLIGYGVDTNMLLTVRVLKRKEMPVMERVMSSVKTGMTMTIIAIMTTIIVLFVNQSEVIRQIMIILLIGLIADIFNTWLQNVALLRMYLERKARKGISS